MITIHNFPRGARGLRIMWQCEEMGVPYRMSPVTFPASEGYRALHPLGSVPFLTDDNAGVSMSESIAIMLWVTQKYGPTPLLPAKDDARLGAVLEMTMFGEAGLGAPLNSLLAARFAAPEEDKRNWSVRGQESRIEKNVRFVAERLTANARAEGGAGESFLCGKELTLADISVACGLAMWRGALGKEVPENVAAYMDRLKERPAYERATKANV